MEVGPEEVRSAAHVRRMELAKQAAEFARIVAADADEVAARVVDEGIMQCIKQYPERAAPINGWSVSTIIKKDGDEPFQTFAAFLDIDTPGANVYHAKLQALLTRRGFTVVKVSPAGFVFQGDTIH